MSKNVLLLLGIVICLAWGGGPLWAQPALEEAQRLSKQSRYTASISLLETYIREHPDRRYDNARAWWWLSYNLLQLDDLKGAEAANDSSMVLRAAIFSDEVAQNYLHSGILALRRGQYSQALSDLDRAGDLPIEDPLLYAQVFEYRGRVLSALARWEEADRAFADAREMLVITEGEQHPDLPALYYQQARSYLAREQPTQALALLQQAYAIAQTTEASRALQGKLLQTMGEACAQEQPKQAERYFRQAWQLFRAAYGHHHRELANLHLQLARLELGGEHSPEQQLDSALLRLCPELRPGERPTLSTQALDRALLAEILRLKAWRWAASHDPDSLRNAYSLGATAANLYLTHIAALYDESEGAAYHPDWGDVFEPGIFAALRLYELHGDSSLLGRALELAERAKWTHLKSRLQLLSWVPAADELRRAMRRAEAQWSAHPSDALARRGAFEARSSWEREHQKLERQAWSSLPQVDSLRARLGQEQALLSYYMGQDHYYLFCLTRQHFSAYGLAYEQSPPAPRLQQSISELWQALKQGEARAYAEPAAQLYTQLIQPIYPHITGKDELIISPHGLLGGLPFEALPAGSALPKGPQSLRFHKRPYLGTTFAVRYTYTLVDFRASEAGSWAGPWYGLAPVFAAGTAEAMLSEQNQQNLSAELGVTTPDGLAMAALPRSQAELSAIARLYGPAGKLRLGPEATEEWLQDSIHSCRILHLATHCFENEREPLWSGISLAQPQGPSREDGICYAQEVLKLQLQGPLVVLRHGHPGPDSLGHSHGPLYLGQSFLSAGAAGVLGSRWNTEDERSTEMLVYFYQPLHAGLSPAHALRQARIKMLRHKRTANPLHWAAFLYLQ